MRKLILVALLVIVGCSDKPVPNHVELLIDLSGSTKAQGISCPTIIQGIYAGYKDKALVLGITPIISSGYEGLRQRTEYFFEPGEFGTDSKNDKKRKSTKRGELLLHAISNCEQMQSQERSPLTDIVTTLRLILNNISGEGNKEIVLVSDMVNDSSQLNMAEWAFQESSLEKYASELSQVLPELVNTAFKVWLVGTQDVTHQIALEYVWTAALTEKGAMLERGFYGNPKL